MKALVKTDRGPGNLQLQELDKPRPSSGEVLIRVKAAGVCGTDIKIHRGEAWSNPPVVMGHEYAGVIEEVGSAVTAWQPGDRVVSETAQVVCGHCEYCKTGRPLMCSQRLSIGYGVNGAFAEYIVVRQEILHSIPENVSFDAAALCEPFAVALHGVWDSGPISPTDTVLVMGPGAIGQLAAQSAAAKGATVVLAGTEADSHRLDVARAMGIPHVVNTGLPQVMEALCGGRGADVVIECTGSAAAIRQSMPMVKRCGRFVQIGLTKPEVEIEYGLLTSKEISIVGSFGHRWHNWKQALDLMAKGSFEIEKLVTAHYSLSDWELAFNDMENQRGIKILIHPEGG